MLRVFFSLALQFVVAANVADTIPNDAAAAAAAAASTTIAAAPVRCHFL